MRKLLLCFALLLSAVPAFAADFGHWFCKDCLFGRPGTDASIGFDQTKEAAHNVPYPTQLHAGDMVTICNGVSCITVKSMGGFNDWIQVSPTFTEDHGGYKNQNSSVRVDLVGSPTGNYTYDVVAYGHYTWYDYYSNDTYSFSSEPVWVLDYYDVTYHNGAECTDSACGVNEQTNQ